MEEQDSQAKIAITKKAINTTRNLKINMKTVKQTAKDFERLFPNDIRYKDIKDAEEYRYQQLAQLYGLIGEYDEAIKCTNIGLKINPRSPYLIFLRGREKIASGFLDGGDPRW